MAQNITNVGHHGNGDVQIFINSQTELPYVLRLIRQAFEQQMEN